MYRVRQGINGYGLHKDETILISIPPTMGDVMLATTITDEVLLQAKRIALGEITYQQLLDELVPKDAQHLYK